MVNTFNDKANCKVCGRHDLLQWGIQHPGWCWWCIKNRCEGRDFDSYGKPVIWEDYLPGAVAVVQKGTPGPARLARMFTFRGDKPKF